MRGQGKEFALLKNAQTSCSAHPNAYSTLIRGFLLHLIFKHLNRQYFVAGARSVTEWAVQNELATCSPCAVRLTPLNA